ncbi:low temperature requirement protein A [Plantactinospora sp. B5E13]|uniref:low temperature requirement protein A n=1 Tax=unclassified Plantactinospora TaxID=2631981 RepID=UPI00325D7BDA
MVGGVLLISTGTSLVVGDPYRDPPLSWVLILLGGPALFLLGTLFFEIVVTGRLLGTRVTAIVVLAASGPAMPLLPSLAVMAVPTLVLLGTLVVELAVNRAGATAESSPGWPAPPQ